jgi:hypothetical protein
VESSDLRRRLFPKGETRLVIVMGLAAALASVFAPLSTGFTGSLLNTWRGAFSGPRIELTVLIVLLPAVLWAVGAAVGFFPARREWALFGYVAGVLAVGCCSSALWLLVGPQPGVPAWLMPIARAIVEAPLVNGLLALVAVVALALVFSAILEPRSAAQPLSHDAIPSGRRWSKGRLAMALGLDPDHEPMARRLALWAIAFTAIGSAVSFLFSVFGSPIWLTDVARIVVLPVVVYLVVRWRGASRTLWVPGALSSVAAGLVVSGLSLVGVLRSSQPTASRRGMSSGAIAAARFARTAELAGLRNESLSLLVSIVLAVLMLVAVGLATRPAAEKADALPLV